MNLDDALRKIKKCLSVAKDRAADPNIAAGAMRQAQALMAEFGLDAEDARLTEAAQESCSTRTNAHPRWEAMLASEIAEAFGCDLLWTRARRVGGSRMITQTGLVFVGIGAAPKIAGYAWDVLSRQCAKARLAHIRAQPGRCKPITLTARGDVFAEGWVIAATSKLQKIGGSEAQRVLIENYMAAAFPHTTSFKPPSRSVGRNVSHGDLSKGYAAGLGAQLDPGVSGRQQGLLT